MNAYDNTILQTELATVLDFWFGPITDEALVPADSRQMQRWFSSTADIDADIRVRFSGLHAALMEALAAGWVADDVDQLLAAIIVLDQFPRNMFRGTPSMFASDHQALALSHILVEHPDFIALDRLHAPFGVMPMMHAEDAGEQARMLDQFASIVAAARAAGSPNLAFFDASMKAAERHKYIVDRFGRFPHRNGILGRESTPEEAAFLKEDNSSF